LRKKKYTKTYPGSQTLSVKSLRGDKVYTDEAEYNDKYYHFNNIILNIDIKQFGRNFQVI